MNKLLIVLLAAVVGITACRKSAPFNFNASNNLYFDLSKNRNPDSILYTFAYHPDWLVDTVWVSVRVSGNRDTINDRVFVVKTIDTATTAVLHKHYEPLKEQYILPAKAGVVRFPVIVYNRDTLLLTKAFSIALKLEPTADFNTDLHLITRTRIVLSGKFEKPFWWDQWVGGNYSQVKHILFRLAGTTEELSMDGMDAPKNLYFVEKLKILLDNPKGWVERNPEKRWKIDEKDDGNFEFYDEHLPARKFLYAKEDATGTFYFIDELGQKVI